MPITPTYPGVYIEEVPSPVRTIVGVSTSVTAFVGYFPRGPLNVPVRLLSMADFERELGGLHRDSETSYAIQQFFLNGGTEAFVVRVASGTGANAPSKASIGIKAAPTGAATRIMTVSAKNEGVWGNTLRVTIDFDTTDPTKFFNLTVTRHESTNPLAPVLVSESFQNLSADSSDTRYFKNVINDESALISVEHDDAASIPPGLPNSSATYSKSITLNAAAIAALNNKTFKVSIGPSGGTLTAGVATLTWTTAPTNLRELRKYVEQAIRNATLNAADQDKGLDWPRYWPER